jgi:hypothetical protein
MGEYYTVKGYSTSIMFLIIALALVVSNIMMIKILEKYDSHAAKKNVLYVLSGVFTLTYFLRSMQLLIGSAF